MTNQLDATQFFQNTYYSSSKDGKLTFKPSMLINISYIFNRIVLAFVLCFVYFWAYQYFQQSFYFLVAPLVLILGSIANLAMRTFCIEYEIKGDKFAFREGFLSRHTGAISIARIQNAEVTQSMLEQFFGIGTVTVNTDDTTVSVIFMIGMKNPEALREAILDSSEAVRKNRGIFEFVKS